MSKEASFFRKNIFLPSIGTVGWLTTAYLKTAEQRLLLLCQLSHAWSSDWYYS